MAAIRKLRITDGPAVSCATWPVIIYVPVPNVDPIPKQTIIFINHLNYFTQKKIIIIDFPTQNSKIKYC
jgi:hypothetical protein